MKNIQPIPFTDNGFTITQLDTDTANLTDVSIDILWYVYDEHDMLVDEGRIQIAGDEFAAYQADPINYPYNYVSLQKGLTIIN